MSIGSPTRSLGIRYTHISANDDASATLQIPIHVPALTTASHDEAPAHVRWTHPRHEVISAQNSFALPESNNFTPIRAQAPTPSWSSIPSSRSQSPPSPASPTSDISQDHTSPSSHPRGRPRTRTLNLPSNTLIRRATSRRLARPSSVDRSTLSNSSPRSETDHSLLEPLPLDRINTSLTEILSRTSTFSSIETKRFQGHRDTFALLDLPSHFCHAPELPLAVFASLALFLDGKSYLALRLTCRCWSAALTWVRPVRVRAAGRLPTEVLMLIWSYLGPKDFDAARRSCRAWFTAGLERGVLARMLRLGGWWGAWEADLETMSVREGGGGGSRLSVVGEEWAMSTRLAFECSLRLGWGGNGIDRAVAGGSSLVLTSETDFSDLSDGCDAALHVTVSVCGKFALIVEGCVIYIYRLTSHATSSSICGGCLEPLTSIICPRHVLAVSMDTSSQRYAIAALMDDRTGLVCDINPLAYRRETAYERAGPIVHERQDYRASVLSSGNAGERIVTEQASSYDSSSAHSYLRSAIPHVRPAAYQSPYDSTQCMPPFSRVLSEKFSGIPIETGPRSIYRSLCSPDDPPLSVAICPQRRCVAFGCSSGIELHWVDALTGQDLNRWFPLTAPSDFLYFLPPRKGVDSAKKLRLISSAGRPGQKGGLRGRFASVGGRWEGAGLVGWGDDEERAREEIDHFKAVPLSDGYHVLFTDPVSGCLCLGNDAPVGRPTKLRRRFMLLGPDIQASELGAATTKVLPSAYAVGQELRWGVRVVVGYGDRIWLFSIPPDLFAHHGNGDREEWKSDYCATNPTDILNDEPQPIKLNGIEVGEVEGLVDLAIDSTPGCFTIWAFTAQAMAYLWQVGGARKERTRKRAVLRDGAVIDLEDHDGDFIMRDAAPPVPRSDLDGASSRISSRRASNAPAFDFPNPMGVVEHHVDADAEIGTLDEDEGYWSDDDDGDGFGRGAFAIHVPPLEGRWSRDEMDWEWEVDHLRTDMGLEGIGGTGSLDILALSRLEFEIL